jgi:hypothetical protein
MVYTTYLMVIWGMVYNYVCFLGNYWSLRLAMKIMKRSFRVETWNHCSMCVCVLFHIRVCTSQRLCFRIFDFQPHSG